MWTQHKYLLHTMHRCYLWILSLWHREPKKLHVKGQMWPVGPTLAGPSLYSSSHLHRVFSVYRVHPGASQCECQCCVSPLRTDALCLLRMALTWTRVTGNRDKPSPVGTFHTFSLVTRQLPYICCLYQIALFFFFISWFSQGNPLLPPVEFFKFQAGALFIV